MSDNPRVALYGAKYTVALANRHALGSTKPMTVAGRHCESGDEIARDVELPADVHPGDLLAVACTGAYQHSMASNYNMVGRPPIVAVRHGKTTELVRRDSSASNAPSLMNAWRIASRRVARCSLKNFTATGRAHTSCSAR